MNNGFSNNEPIDVYELPLGIKLLNVESNGIKHSFKVVKD
jgi:hypothetical protein